MSMYSLLPCHCGKSSFLHLFEAEVPSAPSKLVGLLSFSVDGKVTCADDCSSLPSAASLVSPSEQPLVSRFKQKYGTCGFQSQLVLGLPEVSPDSYIYSCS